MEEDNRRLAEQLEDATRELSALRSHVHNLTEEVTADSGSSIEEMKTWLKEKHIIIIGGHANWVSKIKNVFPGWTYINPEVSGATNTSIVANADFLYFFTDIISHTTYYRFLSTIRKQKISFGYLHGVNIDGNVRQIYRELKGK